MGKVRDSWTEALYVWIIQIQIPTTDEWQVQLKYSRLLDPSDEACRATMLLLEIAWCVIQGKTSWNISAHLRNTQAPKRVPTVGQMGRTVGLLFTYSLQRMFQEIHEQDLFTKTNIWKGISDTVPSSLGVFRHSVNCENSWSFIKVALCACTESPNRHELNTRKSSKGIQNGTLKHLMWHDTIKFYARIFNSGIKK